MLNELIDLRDVVFIPYSGNIILWLIINNSFKFAAIQFLSFIKRQGIRSRITETSQGRRYHWRDPAVWNIGECPVWGVQLFLSCYRPSVADHIQDILKIQVSMCHGHLCKHWLTLETKHSESKRHICGSTDYVWIPSFYLLSYCLEGPLQFKFWVFENTYLE